VFGGGISPEAFIAAESSSAETGQKIKENPNVTVKPQVSDGGISPEAFIAAESRSAEAGQKIKENLNVTVKPQADLSSLLSLDSLLTGILGKLASIGPASAGAASAARVNLNNAYSDFGVSP
jgi:hypothetical protein